MMLLRMIHNSMIYMMVLVQCVCCCYKQRHRFLFGACTRGLVIIRIIVIHPVDCRKKKRKSLSFSTCHSIKSKALSNHKSHSWWHDGNVQNEIHTTDDWTSRQHTEPEKKLRKLLRSKGSGITQKVI